jgi:hypothetical protein
LRIYSRSFGQRPAENDPNQTVEVCCHLVVCLPLRSFDLRTVYRCALEQPGFSRALDIPQWMFDAATCWIALADETGGEGRGSVGC